VARADIHSNHFFKKRTEKTRVAILVKLLSIIVEVSEVRDKDM